MSAMLIAQGPHMKSDTTSFSSTDLVICSCVFGAMMLTRAFGDWWESTVPYPIFCAWVSVESVHSTMYAMSSGLKVHRALLSSATF